jgi:membrane-associated phospholipid phosphatase
LKNIAYLCNPGIKEMINKQVLLRTVYVYVIPYVVLLVAILGLMYAYPKPELHMLLNSHHTSLQDTFFKYYSVLAEWPLYVLALLPLLWKKVYITGFFALCELTGGAILQILKHTINMERPICAFENCQTMVLPLVDGINMHHSNSFPSGHASTFFVFCTCCALLLSYHWKLHEQSRKAWILFNASLLVLLILATLGAYSRIYLSQHFLSDVCMGSIIGFTTPCLMFYLVGNKFFKSKPKEEKLNK